MEPEEKKIYVCPEHKRPLEKQGICAADGESCQKRLKRQCPQCKQLFSQGRSFDLHLPCCGRQTTTTKPVHFFVLEGPWHFDANPNYTYAKCIESWAQIPDVTTTVARTYTTFETEEEFKLVVSRLRLDPAQQNVIIVEGHGDGTSAINLEGNSNKLTRAAVLAHLHQNETIVAHCHWLHLGWCKALVGCKSTGEANYILTGYNCNVDWVKTCSFEFHLFSQTALEKGDYTKEMIRQCAGQYPIMGDHFKIL